MRSQAAAYGRFHGRFAALWVRAALVAALVILGSLFPDRHAAAAGILIAASQNADAGLAACSSNRGKALYDCVATVLDRMSNEVSAARVPETQRTLQTAASRLRAATSKAEAVSAITQCQAAIAGALRQVKAAGGANISGWGDSGLASVVSVLARAVRLIQSKG